MTTCCVCVCMRVCVCVCVCVSACLCTFQNAVKDVNSTRGRWQTFLPSSSLSVSHITQPPSHTSLQRQPASLNLNSVLDNTSHPMSLLYVFCCRACAIPTNCKPKTEPFFKFSLVFLFCFTLYLIILIFFTSMFGDLRFSGETQVSLVERVACTFTWFI